MPPEALHHAKQALINFGFDTRAIVENQSLSISNNETIVFDALAYAHAERRTAKDVSFTIFHAANGRSDETLVPLLAQSTAPFHLIHRDNHFSFWLSKAISKSEIQPIQRHDHIAYGQLGTVLERYAVDFKPQRILDFKQHNTPFPSFPELEPLQLSLFALEATGKLLKDHFKSAANELRNYKIADETVSQLAIQLLGAIILADTGVLGEEIRSIRDRKFSIHALIQLARQQPFGNYFDLDMFQQNGQAIESAYKILGNLRYASFEPHHIADLSLSAYSDIQRKKYGLYDTPLYLTQRIWDNIPIEFLPPDQRHVADMTCGWGSFLISGYDRLANLSDMRDQPMNHYLHGNDVYGPQHLWAKLGLLLSTSRDNWDIQNQDAFAWNWLQHHQPNVIVGNPPFGGDRKTLTGDKSKPTRYEEANQFLEHAINRLAPDGYLAVLMPPSFVAAEASPQLRQKLLTTCDLLELWELPIGTFADAQTGGLVIFAQKRTSNHTPVVIHNIQAPKDKKGKIDKNPEIEQLIKQGKFTVTALVNDQTVWNEKSRSTKGSKNTHIIDYKLILSQFIWKKIQSCCIDLEKLAIVFLGVIRGDNPEKKRWINYDDHQNILWLTGVQRTLPRDFYIDYSQSSTIVYPNELEEPRKDKEKYLFNKKVLLSSINNPSWGKRVKIAIERIGYCVSDSFWVIVPKSPPITLEVVAAVINWKVSNAWILEFLKHAKIPGRAIKTIPFPKNLIDNKSNCHQLTQAVLQLEVAAQANEPEPQTALDTIDTILKQAYQLDEETYQRLTMIYNWDKQPQITLDQQPDPTADWQISGVVDHVDPENGLITLWTDEFDKVITVPIHSAMPGWMLRNNAEFRVKIPYQQAKNLTPKQIPWGRFEPQPYAYMNENELLDALTEAFDDHETTQ